jgi:sigma-70-like protein
MSGFGTRASDVAATPFAETRILGLAMRPATADAESDRDRDWSALMAAAQDGDRGAYERLLREILPLLHAVVARHHRHPDRIEDVVQEVLLTVHRLRHTYDPARSFHQWLMTIIHWCGGSAFPRQCRR